MKGGYSKSTWLWKWSSQSCPTLCDPMDCSPPGSPSMGFSRQEYWSGLPFPSPGDLPNPGIEPRSPALWAEALTSEPPGKPFHEKGWLRGQNWGTRRLIPRPWSLIKKNPTFGQLDFRNVMDSFSPSPSPHFGQEFPQLLCYACSTWILEVLGADNRSLQFQMWNCAHDQDWIVLRTLICYKFRWWDLNFWADVWVRFWSWINAVIGWDFGNIEMGECIAFLKDESLEVEGRTIRGKILRRPPRFSLFGKHTPSPNYSVLI